MKMKILFTTINEEKEPVYTGEIIENVTLISFNNGLVEWSGDGFGCFDASENFEVLPQ